MASGNSPLTSEELQRQVGRLPRFPLAHLPTPFELLPRFSRALAGPNIYIKRDDCTGLALGGNKTRHNEFLIADALEKESDLFVWGAGVQSNNCRQTAAGCAKAGIDCHLVLGKPSRGSDPIQGNLLLDHLVGASYECVDATIGKELDARIEDVADSFRNRGRKVYSWDRGTVKPLAAVSYVLCLTELVGEAAQAGFLPEAVYICSSGSTGSGLVLGAKALGHSFPVRNIAPIRWDWDTQADMARIANEAAEKIDIPTRLERNDVDVSFDYIGPGYGEASSACLEAIALLARTEGILLDPVYSGKAMAALIDHIRHGRLESGQNVVFVHTGGTPALFAYHETLAAGIAPRTL